MRVFKRFSEPYPATGGIASEGIRNLLGRPALEPLELLVRESIQNSWDAKRDDTDEMRVSISLGTLAASAAQILVERVLPDPPDRLPLAGELAASDPQLLVIADRGTIGLQGGLRSDLITENESSDFVDFIRDIGQPPDRHLGAGSFGYGKGAFYLLSRASTIIVHTRCVTHSGPQTRLIACGLGEHFTDGAGVRLTGRHWWGEIASDGIIDPLLGDEADELAAGIDLPPFEDGETGTTIAIVAPRLALADEDDNEVLAGGRQADRSALEFMGRAIAWNFWPKMVSLGGAPPPIRFSVEHDGESVEIPDVETDPRLRVFASAYRTLKEDTSADVGLGGEVMSAWCQRPRRLLGKVSIRRDVVPASSAPSGGAAVGDHLHHIALMRKANLVVQYVSGPQLAGENAGYAGVFECEEDLDQIFRRSEPPTHDRWEPQFLEYPDRRFVNVALTRVREIAERFAAPAIPSSNATTDLAVGEFSSQLAGLIPTLPGPGAAFGGTASGRGCVRGEAALGDDGERGAAGGDGDSTAAFDGRVPGNNSRRGDPRIEVVSPGRPVLVEGEPVLEVGFRVESKSTGDAVVSAEPTILTMDGGAVERDPPQGARRPRLIAWISADGGLVTTPTLKVSHGDDSVWTARFSHQPDAMVRIDLSSEAG
jgi:hypothetical protein